MLLASQDNAMRTGRIARMFIYVFLLVFALFYLLPFFIMAVNSVKPLAEITGGNPMVRCRCCTTWTSRSKKESSLSSSAPLAVASRPC